MSPCASAAPATKSEPPIANAVAATAFSSRSRRAFAQRPPVNRRPLPADGPIPLHIRATFGPSTRRPPRRRRSSFHLPCRQKDERRRRSGSGGDEGGRVGAGALAGVEAGDRGHL